MVNQEDKYSEKVWTRNDGLIDGYVFKGKRSFGPALIGLKNIMQKGEDEEIENVKFKALDFQPRGSGLEFTVEVKVNKDRGVAILKVYGPKEDMKKENSVTITKSKGSESKYVVILAEKVIKPLMNGYLSGDFQILENLQNPIKSTSKNFKCNFCEKSCKTERGLKGHITKKHLNFKENENQNKIEPKDVGITCANKRKNEEISEVVESIISDVINPIRQGKEDVTLEESINEEKKYTKMCNTCDFQVEANKNYISVQKILKHRDYCNHRIQCLQCDLKFKDQSKMKKHMRDVHGLMTSSNSPPLKKKRVENNMITNNTSAENNDIIDLSQSFEEMEIDISDKEEQVLKERSKMMDEKVMAKQRKIDEDVENFLNKKEKIIIKDNQKRKEINQEVLKSAKQNKQKVHKKNEKGVFKYLREVPANCKTLVKEGDLVYVVPGDGACGPNSAAAHLFQDEVFGPRLRKNMNAFFAKHYDKKYKFITPCSPESAFKRRVKNRIIEFTDPKKLIQFLKTSEDAMYMWTDSEDLAIIADMFQMRIKIITTKGANDVEPTVNWIHPDENLKEDAELKNVQINDMVLLHENDMHFNLIVSKNSVLATEGSLSYRNNISPMFEIENSDKKENIQDGKKPNTQDGYEEENKALREELESCKKTLESINEENKKLKVENIALKETKKVNKEDMCSNCYMETKHDSGVKEHKEGQYREVDIICDVCDLALTTKVNLEKHKKLHHKTSEKKPRCSRDCQERQEYIEREYFKCEKDLRTKTEENEKNKIEIKDLRMIIDLREEVKMLEEKNNIENESALFEMKSKGFQRDSPQNGSFPRQKREKTKKFKCKRCDFQGAEEWHLNNHMKLIHGVKKECNDETNCSGCDDHGRDETSAEIHEQLNHSKKGQIKCKNCPEVFRDQVHLSLHMKMKHEENKIKELEFNCNECDFQGNSNFQLQKHQKLKHIDKGETIVLAGNFKCRICEEEFEEKANLMIHRKMKHINVVAQCRNFVQGICNRTPDSCWWNHGTRQLENIQCYVCSKTFTTKSDMMGHRKRNHASMINLCQKFIQGKCPFQDDFCWFIHNQEKINSTQITDSQEVLEDVMETEEMADFQKETKQNKPPSKQ